MKPERHRQGSPGPGIVVHSRLHGEAGMAKLTSAPPSDRVRVLIDRA